MGDGHSTYFLKALVGIKCYAPHTLGSICRILEMRWVGIRQRRMDAKFSLFNASQGNPKRNSLRTQTRQKTLSLSSPRDDGRPLPGRTLSLDARESPYVPTPFRLLAGCSPPHFVLAAGRGVTHVYWPIPVRLEKCLSLARQVVAQWVLLFTYRGEGGMGSLDTMIRTDRDRPKGSH
jgi:hypothetical protein